MRQDIYEKLWASQSDDPKIYQTLWFDLLNASGFAGVLPNGNIVDRRYFPKATPVSENNLFGVAKPKDIDSQISKIVADNFDSLIGDGDGNPSHDDLKRQLRTKKNQLSYAHESLNLASKKNKEFIDVLNIVLNSTCITKELENEIKEVLGIYE